MAANESPQALDSVEMAESQRLERTMKRRETGRLGKVRILSPSPHVESRYKLHTSKDASPASERRQSNWRQRQEQLEEEALQARERFIAERRNLRASSRDRPQGGTDDSQLQVFAGSQSVRREEQRMKQLLGIDLAPPPRKRPSAATRLLNMFQDEHPGAQSQPDSASSTVPPSVAAAVVAADASLPPHAVTTLVEERSPAPAQVAEVLSENPPSPQLVSSSPPQILASPQILVSPQIFASPQLVATSSPSSPSVTKKSIFCSESPSRLSFSFVPVDDSPTDSSDRRRSSRLRSLGTVSEVRAGINKLIDVETRLGDDDRIENLNLLLSRVDQIIEDADEHPDNLTISIPQFHLEDTPHGAPFPHPNETLLPSGAAVVVPASTLPHVIFEDDDNSFDSDSGSEEADPFPVDDSSTSVSSDPESEEEVHPVVSAFTSLSTGSIAPLNTALAAAPLTPQPLRRLKQKPFKLFATPPRPDSSALAPETAQPLVSGQIPESEVTTYFNLLREISPDELVQRKAQRKKKKLAALALTVCTFGIGLPFYVRTRKNARLESQIEREALAQREAINTLN
ncbi:MAG: hypothetical protein Q8P67_01600 [archaeon]|nr:hypothetical protein [archaeon]